MGVFSYSINKKSIFVTITPSSHTKIDSKFWYFKIFVSWSETWLMFNKSFEWDSIKMDLFSTPLINFVFLFIFNLISFFLEFRVPHYILGYVLFYIIICILKWHFSGNYEKGFFLTIPTPIWCSLLSHLKNSCLVLVTWVHFYVCTY